MLIRKAMSGSAETIRRGDTVRVGYLLRMYPRFSQTFVANEIHALEQQGVEVRILSLRKPDDGVFHEAACRVKARAEYVPECPHGRRGRVLRSHWKWLRRSPGRYAAAASLIRHDAHAQRYDLTRAIELLRWVKKNDIDHVHVHFGTSEATVALAAHLLGGLSYSLTLHAFDIFRDNVDRALLARKINHSRFTITVSRFNKTFMERSLPGVDAEKIRVHYNGILLDRFALQERIDEGPSVFALGRLIEKKGFIHLIRAIGRLRDEGLIVRCRIGGDGRERDRLAAEIDRLHLDGQVELLGSIPESTVREWMRRSSCFALPCVEARDGNVDALPTVLLEALALGCPIVTTRLSGNPEIVEDEVSGLLVDPGDEAALAAAIRRLVLNRDEADTFVRNGRKRAEALFDIRKNAAVMREWFEALPR
ncbi:MAG: colanic acid biosynthesis glycosyltransferase WcaL, partial [Planctomycetota bacterium]